MTTTLPAVAGATASIPSAIRAGKSSAPAPGFQETFDSAAAKLQHPSTPGQPAKNRKATGKEDAAPAKEGGSPAGQDMLLSLLVALPAAIHVEPLSSNPVNGNLPAQGLGSELQQGMESMPPIATGDSADASTAAIPGNGVATKIVESNLDGVPPGLAAKAIQSKLPATLQPMRAEAQMQPSLGQPSKTIPVANTGQPVDAHTTVQAAKGGSAQPVPASQPIADTASASTLLKAADPALLSATVQALPHAAALPALVNAGASKPAELERPEPRTAIGPQKAEPPATGVAQQDGDTANAQSDSAPTKKDSVGNSAPAGIPSVQVFAVADSGAMPSVAPGAVSPASVLHEASSGPSLPGASAASQTAAIHSPEPNLSATALPQINTARVLGSMQGTELRVGMHSQEFGSVSIATSVSPGGVAAQISLDHGGLSRALAVHLPSMEERLGHTLGVQARVEVLGTGTGASQSGQGGSAPREGSRQERGLSSVPAASTREQYLAQTPTPETGEQAEGGLRLSVRA